MPIQHCLTYIIILISIGIKNGKTSGKKFWTYQSFHYKPEHVEGKRTALAATWACKNTNGSLLTDEQYKKYLCLAIK